MTIQFHRPTGGLRVPVFICDSCGKEIKDHRAGMAYYGKGVADVKFYHKGACDPKAMESDFDELTTFIEGLANLVHEGSAIVWECA